MILLIGTIYHKLVTMVCSHGDDFRYFYDTLEVLSYIRNVARDDKLEPGCYNPIMYFPMGS